MSPQDELFTESPPFLSDVVFISRKYDYCSVYYIPSSDVFNKRRRKIIFLKIHNDK